MPKQATPQEIQEFNNYRLFETDPKFVENHSGDEILKEFNKHIHPINYKDDKYYGMSEAEADTQRRLDIISKMLEVFGKVTNAKRIVDNKLSPKFWIEWFEKMTPDEIKRSQNNNVFMNIIEGDGLDKLADNEQQFRIVYVAYCRNYLDSILYKGRNSKEFKVYLIDSDSAIWKSALSAAQILDVLAGLNNLVEKGRDWDICANCIQNSKTKQIFEFDTIMNRLAKAGYVQSRQKFSKNTGNLNITQQNLSQAANQIRNVLLSAGATPGQTYTIPGTKVNVTLNASLKTTKKQLILNED